MRLREVRAVMSAKPMRVQSSGPPGDPSISSRTGSFGVGLFTHTGGIHTVAGRASKPEMGAGIGR